MINLITYFQVIMSFLLIVVSLLLFIILRGVGFKNLLKVFRMRKLIKKGYIQVRMHYPTGYPRKELVNISDGQKTFKLFNGVYQIKNECIYYDEYNLPTIDYVLGESEPVDPRINLISVTNAITMDNTISNAVMAKIALDRNKWEELIKKYWWVPVVIIGIVVVGFVYMKSLDSDTMTAMLKACNSKVIYNLTGK